VTCNFSRLKTKPAVRRARVRGAGPEFSGRLRAQPREQLGDTAEIFLDLRAPGGFRSAAAGWNMGMNHLPIAGARLAMNGGNLRVGKTSAPSNNGRA
jgi:hypothetical protein